MVISNILKSIIVLIYMLVEYLNCGMFIYVFKYMLLFIFIKNDKCFVLYFFWIFLFIILYFVFLSCLIRIVIYRLLCVKVIIYLKLFKEYMF